MTYTPYSVMDICSYCEVATESIQKSIEVGDYDGATVRLSAYLLEINSRWRNGEIDTETWWETLRFHRRMMQTILEELGIQQTIIEREREEKRNEDLE